MKAKRPAVHNRKYVFHYNTLPLYWTYARSVKEALRQVDAMDMDIPDCIEDCHGSEIWWKEDHNER